MDLGLDRAGMSCRWQVEIDEYCREVLRRHWPTVPKFADICGVKGEDIEPVDLIAGGFPCQDVSTCGLRRGIGDGTRSGLYSEMVRIVRELRPRYVLVENVPGLLAPIEPGQPAPMARVLGDLAELGFDAEWFCLPAASVGAPHLRNRVFIFAYTRCKPRNVPTIVRHSNMDHGRGNRKAEERGQDRNLAPLVEGVHEGTPADWWRAQSRMDRSCYGIPHRAQRVKALGNAVVPQVAEWIGRRIMEATA